MKKSYFFDIPVDVYGDNGTCYENVVEVFIGDNDAESYIADSEDNILFFNEMDYSMIEEVVNLVDSRNIK